MGAGDEGLVGFEEAVGIDAQFEFEGPDEVEELFGFEVNVIDGSTSIEDWRLREGEELRGEGGGVGEILHV